MSIPVHWPLLAVVVAMAMLGTLRAGMSSPTARMREPDPRGYWGFAVGLYPREARRRGFAFPPDFAALRRSGATHVLCPVSWVQDHTRSTRLYRAECRMNRV